MVSQQKIATAEKGRMAQSLFVIVAVVVGVLVVVETLLCFFRCSVNLMIYQPLRTSSIFSLFYIRSCTGYLFFGHCL
jgi:hypothetical protein